MAKCITNGTEIRRMPENTDKDKNNLKIMINSGNWKYCPRSEWKKLRVVKEEIKKEKKVK